MQLNLFSEIEEIELAEDDPNTRVCRVCGERKELEQFQIRYFGVNNYKGRKYLCRTCRNYREGLIKILKKKHKYPDEIYACPICGVTKWEQREDKPISTWSLDHCHKTDEFRGWLCPRCNTGIGQLEDNVDILRKAMEYLQQHENKERE